MNLDLRIPDFEIRGEVNARRALYNAVLRKKADDNEEFMIAYTQYGKLKIENPLGRYRQHITMTV